MHELYNELTDICETLTMELAKANDKIVSSNGEIGSGDIDYIDKLTHAIKSVKTTTAMLEGEGNSYGGYSGKYYNDSGNSYARRKRDSMGRYSRDSHDMSEDYRSRM